MPDVRSNIIQQYAAWTALSALRSRSPIRSRKDVYGALRSVDFPPLFDRARGRIDASEFDEWHARAVADLCRHDDRLIPGWAAKIINVYLKTRCYVGGEGRDGLADAIHPPIDGGLWSGLKEHFRDRPDITDATHCVGRIKHIESYECYRTIIGGCRAAAAELGCSLIEVEQLWTVIDLSAAE